MKNNRRFILAVCETNGIRGSFCNWGGKGLYSNVFLIQTKTYTPHDTHHKDNL